MLGTYFVLILAMFIVMVVGAVLGYTGFYQIVSLSALTFSPAGSIEDTLKDPLGDALKQYRDNPGDDKGLQAYKEVWNQVQKEVGRHKFLNLNIAFSQKFRSDPLCWIAVEMLRGGGCA